MASAGDRGTDGGENVTAGATGGAPTAAAGSTPFGGADPSVRNETRRCFFKLCGDPRGWWGVVVARAGSVPVLVLSDEVASEGIARAGTDSWLNGPNADSEAITDEDASGE